MIITLKGADFSASNIGTLSSWRITRSLGTGATYEGPTSVDKGAAFSATVAIAEGYELGSAGVTVTMGGNVISAATVDGNVITITIAEVTGNIVIKVPTINVNTGEEDEPEVPDVPEGGTDSIIIPLTATSTATDTYIDKITGAVTDGISSVRYIFSVTSGKEYYASGYAPSSSGSAAAVAYFDADGNYISYESPASGSEYSDYKLTVPSNAKTVSIHSTNKYKAPALSMTIYGTLITATSTVNDTYIALSDGTETSGVGSIRQIYPITNATKTYYATGYTPGNTAVAAIAYFNSSGTYISGERFTAGVAFNKQLLTIPANTASLSIHGISNTTFELFCV